MNSPDETRPQPALRVVHGSPNDVEIAALTAVVTVVGAGHDDSRPSARRGGWNDPAARHRRPPVPGPNAWRATYLR